MDFDAKEFLIHLDLFGGRLFTYNHTLIKRSEDEKQLGSESFTDVIDFYLTSQISFDRSMLMDYVESQMLSQRQWIYVVC